MKSTKKYTFISVLLLSITTLGLFAFSFSDDSRFFAIVKNLELYESLYREVHKSYVDDVEPAKLMRSGIDSMLKSLDPYTNYISEGQIEGYRMQQGGGAGNIGAGLVKKKGDPYVTISQLDEGTPAFEAGMMVGDRIMTINGATAKNRSVDDVQKVLVGEPGSEVIITYERLGKSSPQTAKVVRKKNIKSSIPYFGMVDEKTAYVKLRTFIKRGCTQEVKAAIEKLKNDNEVESIIIDLRHNGGGLLGEAVNMVNLFVEQGEMVVSTKGKVADWQKEYKTPNAAFNTEIPLVVLTDGRSASASEIFAGCMQDHDRGVVIGQRTFGKGLVQQTRDIGYNSKLKLTVAKYYLPSGRCVQAIDYSGRYKDGAIKVPDSLRTKFYSKNKRLMYDGGGVDPDIAMEKKEYARITQSLLKEQLILDFVSDYRRRNEEIAPADTFEVSEALYEQFVAYVNEHSYAYDSKTEELIEKLKKSTSKEKYDASVKQNLEQIAAKVKQAKTSDIYRFKDEIAQLLKEEIIGRYYYEKGKVQASLDSDPIVQEALSLFEDKTRYKQILEGN